MVSKAFPYSVSASDAFGHLRREDVNNLPDDLFRKVLKDHVKAQMAYGDELEEWLKVNARGRWRRVQLEFDFKRKEDAAMFRLRVGEGSTALIHKDKR